MTSNRREMLVRTTQALGGFALAAQVAPLFAAPEKRRFKIGACEWSLRKSDPGCFEVAKQIGLDGVQVDMGRASNGMWLRGADVQQKYLAAAKASGLQIASLAMAELNNIALKSEPRAAIWLHDAIDVAKALGVKVILVAQFHNGDLRNDKQGTDRTVELLKELAHRLTGGEGLLRRGQLHGHELRHLQRGSDAQGADLRVPCEGRRAHARQGPH